MPIFTDIHYKIHKIGDNNVNLQISDQDTSGDPQYYGYVDTEGGWVIMQQNIANGTYRYAVGRSDYNTYWAIKATLTYNRWDEVF